MSLSTILDRLCFFINKCGLKVDDIGTGTKGDFFVKFVRDDRFEKAFAEWRQGGH